MFFNHDKKHEQIYQMGFFPGGDDQARVQQLLQEIRDFVRKPLETACDMRPDEEKTEARDVLARGTDRIKGIVDGTSTETPDDNLDASKENEQPNRGPGART